MVLTGEAITIGTLVLPSLLIVIGSTYSIYIIAQYEDEVPKGGTAKEVVQRALARVTVPVVVAAFTTVVGFVMLLVNRCGLRLPHTGSAHADARDPCPLTATAQQGGATKARPVSRAPG
jgi:hypothetical protein